ncbi:MAG TPA: flagellar assembly peptidoglycan hydrolase FlgJ [Pseudomonas xinjiangensis]|uniref:Peptidoglycan hydrolase FlgJ n=2 Tax=root TaxID=1 RepID=A0A7V1BR21_9GAMM|nr:flagellar assembly peptidoglycan hydrolase FlgJ [Halopseudomonas xinjiangensis]HEC46204.1 flagellar assembly peptidoglycan hydrolase FlgJ [Halopseudomonas xinjiangensis]
MNVNSSNMSYTDLNAMSQLKAGSEANSPENMRRVAEQFESLFMNMMIKSMRDANASFGEDNPLNTPQTKMYQDMYDSQMAVHLSEKQGVGLADVMLRQLSPNKDVSSTRTIGAADTVATAPTTLAADATPGTDQSALLARRRLAVSLSYSAQAGAVVLPGTPATKEASASWQPMRSLQGIARPVTQTAMPVAPHTASLEAGTPMRAANARFDSPEEFAAAMLPMAEKAAKRLGVDPHYLVAQAALETGWGKSIIKQKDGVSSHNLFGIKTHGVWEGESASVMTSEYRDGVKGTEKATFRSYGSFEQSFDDYVSFLENNGRYEKALGQTQNPDVFFRELQKAGYATDPHYARKVSQIAQRLLSDAPVRTQTDNAASEGRA